MVLRLAVVSMHTSPLDPPGVGDAGGLNVYVHETAAQLVRAGVEVTVFTRARSLAELGSVRTPEGYRVESLAAGPLEQVAKDQLPEFVPEFSAGLAARLSGHDLVHSHYWLSGLSVAQAVPRLPHVHTAHTMARAKNAALAPGQQPEPSIRLDTEQWLLSEVQRLTVNTHAERDSLLADGPQSMARVDVVAPGVDLANFRPGHRAEAKRALGLNPDRHQLLFVGRIQPLKGPDLLIRAADTLVGGAGRDDLEVVICGDLGTGSEWLLAQARGASVPVRFEPAQSKQGLAAWYRAASLTAMPSHSESFGIVALESQACGTPVVVSDVGGLRTSAQHDVGGITVAGRQPEHWGRAMDRLLSDEGDYQRLSSGARAYAEQFSWQATAAALYDTYECASRPAWHGNPAARQEPQLGSAALGAVGVAGPGSCERMQHE